MQENVKVTSLEVCVCQDIVSVLDVLFSKGIHYYLDKIKDIINGVSDHLWSVYDHILLTYAMLKCISV